MAGEATAVGVNTGAAPQGAPTPMEGRSKISDMSRTLSHGVPATPAPLAIRQGAEPTPIGDVQPRGNMRPPLGFDDSGNPDLGHPGDLDAEAHALAREADGLGAELENDYADDPNQLELDDSAPSEVMDPGEYERIKALMDADDLPAEWDDKKWTTVPIKARDGSTYEQRLTLGEVKGGYMRHEDYSQKLGEVSQMRQHVLNVQQGQQRMIADLSGSPQTFVHAMRTLNIMPVFLATMEAWAKEVALPEQRLRDANPAAYQQYQARQAEAERALALEREKQTLLAQLQQIQQQQPAQMSENTQQIANQLAQMLPLAYKRADIDGAKARSATFKLIWDEPAGSNQTRSEQIFAMHWSNLITAHQGPVTTQFVQSVVAATKETVDAMVREMLPQRRGQVTAAAPAPNPGGARTNGARVPQRAKIGDMGKMLRGG